jgi:hypothetical protein
MLREESSRWDPTRIAQYEVLGNDAKKDVRPVRDDRRFGSWSLARGFTSVSSRRSGTDRSFLNANPPLRTGLLSLVLQVRPPLRHTPSCYADAVARMGDSGRSCAAQLESSNEAARSALPQKPVAICYLPFAITPFWLLNSTV